MSALIELDPKPLSKVEGGYRRSCSVTEVSFDGKKSSKEIWIVYPSEVPPTSDDDADSYLLAVLLPAMRCSSSIKINGSVSKELLSNLSELQLVWSKWCPDLYSVVNVTANKVREVETKLPHAICAFSGGVDALFTAYRHSKKLAGYRSQVLRGGVFVHGFDIPLCDREGFNRAAERASFALEDIGLPLLRVETNLGEFSGVNWEHYYGMALASVLVGFKQYAGTGLIGSCESYDCLVAPWGSHPMTNHLLSSGGFGIVHDGAGYNRSEKVDTLVKWSAGVKSLRACYAGSDRGYNCGVCEKCVRTRLNFLLTGESSPSCFEGSLTPELFSRLRLRSEAVKAEWASIRSEMRKKGEGLEYLKAVDRVLSRSSSPKFSWLLPVGSKRRNFVKKIIR